MHIEEYGPTDAPVIVFIHGAGVGGWMWDPQVSFFQSNYHLLIPDLPGHARSVEERFTSHTEISASLATTLNRLPEGTDVTVVGFSFGAQIATLLAASLPEKIRRVVVISGMNQPIYISGLMTLAVGLTAPLCKVRPFALRQAEASLIPPHLTEEYLDTLAGLSFHTLTATTHQNFTFRIPPTWPSYPGDALLLAGSEEPKPLLRSMYALHQALPNSTLRIYDHAGHGVSMQHPDLVNTRIQEFIADSSAHHPA